jgi:putative transposase
MAHHDNPGLPDHVLQLLTEHGYDGSAEGQTPFYPSALDKGLRSEQALKFALAEMYVQGVFTRKVSAIVEELCGISVSSTQVRDCAKLLDAELQKCHDRPLGQCPPILPSMPPPKRSATTANYATVPYSSCLGITASGHRTISGVNVALSEAEEH